MTSAKPHDSQQSTKLKYAATHCTYPRRDGQAELMWEADNMPRRLPIPTLTGFIHRDL